MKQEGAIFAFLPADGGSRAGAVAEHLSRTLAEGSGPAVLLADFETRGYPLWRNEDAPRRLDGRTWGAWVVEQDGRDVLAAPDVNPRELARLLDGARNNYGIILVDLSAANAEQTGHVVSVSEAVFIVSGAGPASLAAARTKLASLQAMEIEERGALLLQRESDSVSASDAEELTGLPVCGYVDKDAQIGQLAQWLAANLAEPEAQVMVA